MGGCLAFIGLFLLSIVICAVVGGFIFGGLVYLSWTYLLMGLVGGPALPFWIFFLVGFLLALLGNRGGRD